MNEALRTPASWLPVPAALRGADDHRATVTYRIINSFAPAAAENSSPTLVIFLRQNHNWNFFSRGNVFHIIMNNFSEIILIYHSSIGVMIKSITDTGENRRGCSENVHHNIIEQLLLK